MVREHHQSRHADSLLILDLPDYVGWPEDAIETAISLAATLCVQQTRASSGGRYLLGIAAKTAEVIASRSPTGFREDALDALAMCRTSSKANLNDLLAAMVTDHGLASERMILITPRPKEAAAALSKASRLYAHSAIDLEAQTSIVKADEETLQSVFRLHDEDNRHDDKPSTKQAVSKPNQSAHELSTGGAA